MTVLEENGGSDGNSSVAELEVRVETLEETSGDHEIRISTAESDINGKRLYCNLRLVFLFRWIAVLFHIIVILIAQIWKESLLT